MKFYRRQKCRGADPAPSTHHTRCYRCLSGTAPDIAPITPDPQRLVASHNGRRTPPCGYAQPTRHAATDAGPDATGGPVDLALVPQRQLPPQGADGAGATHYQVGRGRFERPSAAIGALPTLRQQGRRPSASECAIKRHWPGFSRTGGRLAGLKALSVKPFPGTQADLPECGGRGRVTPIRREQVSRRRPSRRCEATVVYRISEMLARLRLHAQAKTKSCRPT